MKFDGLIFVGQMLGGGLLFIGILFGPLVFMDYESYKHPTGVYHGPEGNCYDYGTWHDSYNVKCFNNHGEFVCEYNAYRAAIYWCG